MDERAQSLGIAGLILSLVGGAFVIWIVTETATPLLNHARNATAAPEANAATGWFETAIVYMPALFLIIGMFGLIVFAVYLRVIQQ